MQRCLEVPCRWPGGCRRRHHRVGLLLLWIMAAGLLLSVTADCVIRLVPPLILTEAEADDEERGLRGRGAALKATERREDAPHAEQGEGDHEESRDGAAAQPAPPPPITNTSAV